MLLLLAHKGVGLNKKNTYLTPPPTPLLPSRFYLIYSYFMASFLHHACPPNVFFADMAVFSFCPCFVLLIV